MRAQALDTGRPALYKPNSRKRANSSAEERRPYKAVAAGSNPASPTENLNDSGAVVKSVITPACHAGGRGFESRPLRDLTDENLSVLVSLAHWFCTPCDGSSGT